MANYKLSEKSILTHDDLTTQIKSFGVEFATSFSELDKAEQLWKLEDEIQVLNSKYDYLRFNVIQLTTQESVLSSLKNLAQEYTNRLTQIEEKVNSEFFAYKDLQGNYRWYGWVTNKWIDRDNEIITDAAHKEFEAYLDNNPSAAPRLWTWHTKSTMRTHPADWWSYDNGIFSYSGILTEEEYRQYKSRNWKDSVGMSHGFIPLAKEGNLINKYRTYEVSDLPLNNAANPYTSFEVNIMNERKKAFLIATFGEELGTKMAQDKETMSTLLADMGINTKEQLKEYMVEKGFFGEESPEETKEEAVADVETTEVEVDDVEETVEVDEVTPESTEEVKESNAGFNMDRVMKNIMSHLNLNSLNETIIGLQTRQSELEAEVKELRLLANDVKELQKTKEQEFTDNLYENDVFTWGAFNEKAVSEDVEDEKEDAKETTSFDSGFLSGLFPEVN